MNSTFILAFTVCMVGGLFLVNAFPLLIFPGSVAVIALDVIMRGKRTA